MRKIITAMTFAFMVTSAINIAAQDIKYVRKQLERLCSREFQGRGYYHKGDSIAAYYLAGKLRNLH